MTVNWWVIDSHGRVVSEHRFHWAALLESLIRGNCYVVRR